MLKYQVAIS